jgi:hypothetical protein
MGFVSIPVADPEGDINPPGFFANLVGQNGRNPEIDLEKVGVLERLVRQEED